MYNETYINTLRKSYLNDILNKRIPLPSINSRTCKDKQIYFVFQHYLLKKLANNEDKNRVLEFLMIYYKDLEQNPSLFVTSPLINNRVMDEIIRDKDLRDRIKAKRDSFYDGRLIPTLREKSKRNTLTSQEKEKNNMANYLKVILLNAIKRWLTS